MKGALLGAALLIVASVAACSSGSVSAPPATRTRTITHHVRPDNEPIDTGPTRAARAPTCPLLGTQEAADRVGMRLARITVLRSGGRVVGCRFYALQNSPLHNSEHLPGPHQPAIEIVSGRYRSAAAAHNAFVRTAARGRDPQRARIAGGTGVCFRTDFYPRDHGTDWACGFSEGKTSVLVRTVVTTPALNAVLVARAIAGRF